MPSIRSELNIPLYVTTHSPRRTLPTGVVDLLLYVNIEYEVDELRRDKIPELANRGGGGIKCTFIHGKLLVETRTLFT